MPSFPPPSLDAEACWARRRLLANTETADGPSVQQSDRVSGKLEPRGAAWAVSPGTEIWEVLAHSLPGPRRGRPSLTLKSGFGGRCSSSVSCLRDTDTCGGQVPGLRPWGCPLGPPHRILLQPSSCPRKILPHTPSSAPMPPLDPQVPSVSTSRLVQSEACPHPTEPKGHTQTPWLGIRGSFSATLTSSPSTLRCTRRTGALDSSAT